MLFLFEQIGFYRAILYFFFSQACKSARRKQQNILLNNRTRRNYNRFLSINGAKAAYGCVDAVCTEFVEDGVRWRNFVIKVKILQVVIMTRNFHNNSKEDFIPYWFDVAVTGLHVILIPSSFLSGRVRH